MGNWFTDKLFSFFMGKDADQNTTVNLITWDSSYEIGHELIDQQHQTLVNMINELNTAYSGDSTSDREALGKILSKLVNYTVFHFGVEEDLFKNTAYPHVKEHIKLHESMVDKISTFQEEFNKGDADISNALLSFLVEWLTKHIHGTDQGYGKYI